MRTPYIAAGCYESQHEPVENNQSFENAGLII